MKNSVEHPREEVIGFTTGTGPSSKGTRAPTLATMLGVLTNVRCITPAMVVSRSAKFRCAVCTSRRTSSSDDVVLVLLVVLAELVTTSQKIGAKSFDFDAVSVHFEDQGFNLARLWLLVDVLNQASLSLDAPVGDLADLLRVERLPRLVIQVLVEGYNVDGVDEVDEGVANVTPIIEVKWQVEEVIAALMIPVDALEQHLFRVLVRNVPDHNSRAAVLALEDALQVHLELGVRVLLRHHH